jgi:hypothetical protein
MALAVVLGRRNVQRRNARTSERYMRLARMYQARPWRIGFAVLWISPVAGYIGVRLGGGSVEAAAFGALLTTTALMLVLIVAAIIFGYFAARD